MDDQLSQDLAKARQLLLLADAQLRYYAYVPKANDEEVTRARSVSNMALDVLWQSLEEKTWLKDDQHTREVLAAFTQATEALVVLIEILGRNRAPGPAYRRTSY